MKRKGLTIGLSIEDPDQVKKSYKGEGRKTHPTCVLVEPTSTTLKIKKGGKPVAPGKGEKVTKPRQTSP